MQQVEALGMSTQRATFTTWNRKSGVPFHNFISWQDQRAADLVKSWNASCTMKVIHGLMKMLYFLTQQKRYLAASLIVFSPQHVTMRLLWILQHYTQVRQACEEGTCCFGTIDTWLLFKLTKGRVHATDYSNASSTGIFDSYQMCWSGFLCSLVSLPLSIFPTVQNTSHNFGSIDPSVFGVPIPIMSVMADQQAAMFGECCFNVGDVKITMGTGTFMDINTGSKPHTSVAGLYPLVGWKIGSEVVYLAGGERSRHRHGHPMGAGAGQTSSMAYSVPDSDGVCFVPSFSGLQAPLNDPKACASLMGLKPSSTKSHLIRAILESVAFRRQLYETMLRETNIPITNIRVDGGVSSNDFVMQLTADLCGRKLVRLQHREMSCLGAALVAGLGTGFWRTREELRKLQSTDEVFLPRGAATGGPCEEYAPILRRWERALQRSMNWYKP
ncbi:putative glycerol kinase 5 [Oryzias melastigma]|uniref:Glycerol kinase 5 n=1 Tax=Oryzias melastigma TaxID=30732 RepID=A0A834CLK8_ORYME|nr:putative glycerol kinase 5 [Oryzias melastigma]